MYVITIFFFSLGELVAISQGADLKMITKLPKILTANPNVTNVNVKDEILIMGKNGGKLGIIAQGLFECFSTTEVLANEVSKQLNITNEQYNQLVKESFEELNHIY